MDINPGIFKAYDIRGIYPADISEETAYAIGQAYAAYVKPQGEVAVGHDVRNHSLSLKTALISGLNDAGVDVVDIGLISTDMYYFAVGHYQFAGGIQVTASHNPPEWHGMKMVRERVIPLTLEAGIGEIRDFIVTDQKTSAPTKGKLRQLDITKDYFNYLLTWIDPQKVKPLKVVANANFGMAGKYLNQFIEFAQLPLEIVELNFTPDGNFPKGRPDPFVPENRVEFVDLVRESKADFGVAWDADADRAFFSANTGLFLDPYYLNTILIKMMLEKFPGSSIIYDPRYTWALIEAIETNDGQALPVRVGHSYIKEAMRKHDALFATESSGHTYYRDFWYADNGMLPLLQVIEYLSTHDTDLLSAVKPVMEKYYISGEINTKVSDPAAKIEAIKLKYSDAEQSTLDGISIEYPEFRFTVRASNTEPLLRLTLEAKSEDLMQTKRDEVLALIQS